MGSFFLFKRDTLVLSWRVENPKYLAFVTELSVIFRGFRLGISLSPGMQAGYQESGSEPREPAVLRVVVRAPPLSNYLLAADHVRAVISDRKSFVVSVRAFAFIGVQGGCLPSPHETRGCEGSLWQSLNRGSLFIVFDMIRILSLFKTWMGTSACCNSRPRWQGLYAFRECLQIFRGFNPGCGGEDRSVFSYPFDGPNL